MKIDQAKQITGDAIDQLAQALGRGQSEQMLAFLAALAKFHRYSFGNVLLIAFQRPGATRVAGFTSWLRLGRHVKKGEKGIAVIAPMMPRARIAPNDQETPGEQAPQPIRRFRVAYVFDISQTEGEPLPEHARVAGDPAGNLDRLKGFITAKGITLEYAEMSPGQDGLSSGGRIAIRPGLQPAEEFSVAVHELAHELLHHRGDRPASKTIRETEAEAVAYVVSTAIGLQTGSASSDYILTYQGDAKILAGSLDRIQRTAAEIIAAITVEEDRPNEARTVAAITAPIGERGR